VQIARALRRRWSGPTGAATFAGEAGALVIAIAMVVRAIGSLARRVDLVGTIDWDSHLVYRELTVMSLRHGEMPFWAPHLCGGNALWGYAEGATNLISPYLPAYLLLPLSVAIRVEVAGAAVIMMLGCWLLAGRFTRSVSLRLLVVALAAINGRWALHTAVGHTWHLQYCWMPFAIYFFDRALDGRRLVDVTASAAALALLVYTGGIYPLPHTVLILLAFALVAAATRRSFDPLVTFAIIGAAALGLAAPKLLPLLEVMRHTPRLIDSTETLTATQLIAAFTAKWDKLGAGTPVPIDTLWWWHEYGIYIGWAGVAVLVLGVVLPGGKRALTVKLTGLLLLLLGCGAFHALAPWTLLHNVPLFSSQHVPSRFLYPAVLLLSVSFAAGAQALLQRRFRDHPWLDVALLVPVAIVFYDVTWSAERLIPLAFTRPLTSIPPSATFHHESRTPLQIDHGAQAPMIMLPGVLANVGTLECYGVPKVEHPGARAWDAADYRGEAYVDGGGEARIIEWTTQHAVVEFSNATDGAHVVYNMNYDEGWRANDEPAEPWKGAVATRAFAPGGTVVFRYRPRTFVPGVAICVVTIGALVAAFVAKRRRAPMKKKID
jgi:hypothetical protein